jgi:hypothetical protein
MNRTIIVNFTLFCLLLPLGLTAVRAQEAADGTPQAVESEAPSPTDLAPDQSATDETPGPAASPRKQSQSGARGLRMDEDGFVRGQIVYIDPHSLDQVPVAGAIVTFIQQRQIVAQSKSGVDGIFYVEGLSPFGTYSMIVRSPEWVAIMGTVVTPEDMKDEEKSVRSTRVNKFVFASLQDTQPSISSDSTVGDPAFQAIQVIPWQDFCAAIQLGVLDCCTGPPEPQLPSPPGTGGGGAAGAGYGGAAAAAWAAAAAAWGAGASNEGDDLASPFTP